MPGMHSIKVSSPLIELIVGGFPLVQFCRGYGSQIDWITDPTLLRTAKLEIDSLESLTLSQVVGIFGSIMNPNILFQQSCNVGVYFSLLKNHFLLSQNNDFFAAGIEYST